MERDPGMGARGMLGLWLYHDLRMRVTETQFFSLLLPFAENSFQFTTLNDSMQREEIYLGFFTFVLLSDSETNLLYRVQFWYK